MANHGKKHDDNRVAIGCGSLLLILIIVLFFGNLGSEEIGRDVTQINERLDRMEDSLDRIEDELETQRDLLNRMNDPEMREDEF